MKQLEILTQIIDALTRAEAEKEALDNLMIAPESPLNAATNTLTDALIKAAKLIVNDEYDWIEWYVYDNDLGRKALAAGMPGNLKPIITPADLLEVIG